MSENSSNFFSSGLRQKVDQLMDILWAGGANYPMDSIKQCSYESMHPTQATARRFRQRLEALFQSMLHRAFNGEL
jgi:hypothetical protein